jgi:hypothetical protein
LIFFKTFQLKYIAKHKHKQNPSVIFLNTSLTFYSNFTFQCFPAISRIILSIDETQLLPESLLIFTRVIRKLSSLGTDSDRARMLIDFGITKVIVNRLIVNEDNTGLVRESLLLFLFFQILAMH